VRTTNGGGRPAEIEERRQKRVGVALAYASPTLCRRHKTLRGVGSGHRDRPGPMIKGAAMSDKSPRQTMAKKSGKSLKEKRAAKHAKAAAKVSSTEALLHDKKR